MQVPSAPTYGGVGAGVGWGEDFRRKRGGGDTRHRFFVKVSSCMWSLEFAPMP